MLFNRLTINGHSFSSPLFIFVYLYFARQNVQALSALAYRKDSFFQSAKERASLMQPVFSEANAITNHSVKNAVALCHIPYSVLPRTYSSIFLRLLLN